MAAGGPRRCGERPWDHWLAALKDNTQQQQQQQQQQNRRPGNNQQQQQHRKPPARLRRAHMHLHGQLPAAPPLLALCALCGAAVALCAARTHLVERHANPTLPPPPLTPPRHKRRTRPHHNVPPEPQESITPIVPVTTSVVVPSVIPPPEPQPALDVRPIVITLPTTSSTPPLSPVVTPTPSRDVAPVPISTVEPPAEEPPAESVRVVSVSTGKSKSKSGKSASSKPKYAAKEYDPNKHCGVVTVDSTKPCTRSLTCKSHALSLRRAVGGRVKPFDALLAEHRAAKQSVPVVAVETVTASNGQIAVSVSPGLSSPLLISAPIDVPVALSPDEKPVSFYSSTLPPVNDTVPVSVPEESDLVPLLHRDVVECLGGQISIPEPPAPVAVPEKPRLPEYRPSEVHWYVNSPRPLATCTFSSCQMGNALLLSKRLAAVRSNFKSAIMQPERRSASSGGGGSLYNFGQNTLSSSLGKAAVQVNSAAGKYSVPKVRKLVMTCPAFSGTGVKTDPSVYYGSNAGSRQNGHLFASKRPYLSDFEEDAKCMRTGGGPSVNSVRAELKVTKHSSQTDMLDLNYMFDPLMADEKC